MQAASVSYRAYAIDMWGFGDSAKNPVKYTIQNQVDLVNSFMEKLGISRVALIGHSLGAVVALEFAAKFQANVDRVMAVSFPLNGTALNPRLRSSTPDELAEWLLSRTPANEAVRIEAPKADYQALATSLEDLDKLSLGEMPFRTHTPCLFVHGQNDPMLIPPNYEDYSHLPDYTHQILLEQSGHFPMLEEVSKFNRLMADFLALSSGVSPRQLQLKEEWKRRVR